MINDVKKMCNSAGKGLQPRTYIYSRSNLNASVNFISYLVIGNLTMMETDCYNVSHIQRPIDDRFEFCKKLKY